MMSVPANELMWMLRFEHSEQTSMLELIEQKQHFRLF